MQLSTPFIKLDRGGTVEQGGELFCGVPKSFLQYSPACLGFCERGYRHQRRGSEFGTEIVPKILAQSRIIQLIGLVSASERALARAWHKPQT